MTPEEAYEEALRRIREAEKTGAVELDLRGLSKLARLPPELERLTSLQKLNLSSCYELRDLVPLARLTSLKDLLSESRQLSDLSPLANLTSLQRLILWLNQLSDLSSLGELTSLQRLRLSECRELSDLSPLANLTSLKDLYLSECNQLSDLSPLANLTSLHGLSLNHCSEIGDLSPLANLTSLQGLDLNGCSEISDLSPLANLTSLQELYLDNCTCVRKFAPLKLLPPTLKTLTLFGCQFDDLPTEVCGIHEFEDVVDRVRAHYADLKFSERRDADVKVFFLGNGGVGKTQLCRRLSGLAFDPKVPTTHGVQLGEMTVTLDDFHEPVRLNLWDFGGQDIYHGSHALFLSWTCHLSHTLDARP